MAQDETVQSLMAKIEIAHDPAQEAAPGSPRTESARVRITLEDGREFFRFVPHVLGFPSHPMDAADVESKAFNLMVEHLGPERAQAVIAAVRGIETLPDCKPLIELIAR